MELDFETRFKHPFSMIVAGSSGSGKTVFTKQLLNFVDTKFIKIYWFYSEWQDGYEDCQDVTFIAGMPDNLDEYLEITGPKMMVFDDMMTQCAQSELIAKAFTQKRHHQNLSIVLILQNLLCQGKVMRNVHLNAQYIVLFQNPRDRSQFGHIARQLEPKHSKALVEAYMDATAKPYSHLLVDLKPFTPGVLRYRSECLSKDRQIVYVIGSSSMPP